MPDISAEHFRENDDYKKQSNHPYLSDWNINAPIMITIAIMSFAIVFFVFDYSTKVIKKSVTAEQI